MTSDCRTFGKKKKRKKGAAGQHLFSAQTCLCFHTIICNSTKNVCAFAAPTLKPVFSQLCNMEDDVINTAQNPTCWLTHTAFSEMITHSTFSDWHCVKSWPVSWVEDSCFLTCVPAVFCRCVLESVRWWDHCLVRINVLVPKREKTFEFEPLVSKCLTWIFWLLFSLDKTANIWSYITSVSYMLIKKKLCALFSFSRQGTLNELSKTFVNSRFLILLDISNMFISVMMDL